MTSTIDVETSEDVNDFLQRIRELGEKRDKEDEERTKKLEEEILQGRKERQARRAERARSISPTKDSPVLDAARLSVSSFSQRAIDPPEQFDPTPRTPEHNTSGKFDLIRDDELKITEKATEGGPGVSQLDGSDMEVSPRASPFARSRAGTLSWQQRPLSRDLSGNRLFLPPSPTRSPTRLNRERAMSLVANDDHKMPETQVLLSPSAKDASPVRQTAEKDPSPSTPTGNVNGPFQDTTSTHNSNHKDTEINREYTADSEQQNCHQDVAGEQSRSPSRTSSPFGDSSLGNRYSSVSSVSTPAGLGSPVPSSSAQKFEPDQITSPSSRRFSPERSTSPTKGLGGFVQSAMMKRSDSVSKRWSAQIASGHSRGNSLASNRSSVVILPSEVFSPASPSRLGREGSSLPGNRPNSSHSEATVVHHRNESERPATPLVPIDIPNMRSDESVGRSTPHKRSTSTLSKDEQNTDSKSLPSSPAVSRTMDPRRWSPTKSTWLESALNRPDSPTKHKRQPSQQPSWSRDRQSRGSIDLGRGQTFKEVTPVGLMRSAALGNHYKTPSVSGIPDMPSSVDTSKAKDSDPDPISDFKESDLTPVDRSPEAPPKTEAEPGSKEEDTTRPKRAPPSLALVPKADIPLSPPRGPLLSRPKTQPAVIDFRANLRRREVVKDDSPKQEPEFKNVFGKLRKAGMSNYVAPDALKENILRGKAVLNATDGPQKSQRVDELKESILRQKEAMKAGGVSLRRNTAGENEAPTDLVPEAIAKRNKLSKSNSVKSIPSANEPLPQSHNEPAAQRGSQDHQHSPLPSSDAKAGEPQSQNFAATACMPDEPQDQIADPVSDGKSDEIKGEVLEDKSDIASPEMRHGNVNEEAIKPVRALPSGNVVEVANAPAAARGLATKGKLAGRINPALAGLVSRGPPVITDSTTKALTANTTGESSSESPINRDTAPLAHMTKNRARGPKRRLPKGVTTEKDENFAPEALVSPFDTIGSEAIPSPVSHTVGRSNGWPLPDDEISSHVFSERALIHPSPTSKPTEFKRSFPRMIEKENKAKPDDDNSKPSTDLKKSPRYSGVAFENIDLGDSPSRRPSLPAKPIMSPSTPVSGQKRGSQIQYSSPSPSPLRTSFRENQIRTSVTAPQRTPTGLAIGGLKDLSPQNKALPSPPVPPKWPKTSVEQQSSPSSSRSSTSLVPQAEESLQAISSFFKTFPSSNDRMNIDTQLILTSKNDDLKIRTLKKQIWEITGDGKKQDLPINHEYILYEGSMYLCVHVFESVGSTRSEAHLWCGDAVSDAAVDDAQSFSRKVAKENGCKLDIIKQGKEPSHFIQALGGILITRRGYSSRSSSSAIFMLCGRKHLGQMVFDEVDFLKSNLCSGYSFVISAMFGKLYLWKGKGSTAEEIGAARLIGMDLGLTGEFEEMTEGEEPESFSEVFSYPRETGDYMRSDYWRLKPSHDQFRLRLFRVDHELGQQSGSWFRKVSGSSSPVVRPNDTIQEVVPFCQKDLISKGIYVLDTFFEIYVIVGEQASHRPAEFASAVVFAHEYGILAASLQDRPFIPNSLVSIGGLPDSCRSAFRKWNRPSWQTPPRVFSLNAAIESIRS